MPKEYLGIISDRTSQGPLDHYPTLWLAEDTNGGFSRFKTKLDLNQLRFSCCLLPIGDAGVKTAIAALIEECSSQGKAKTNQLIKM